MSTHTSFRAKPLSSLAGATGSIAATRAMMLGLRRGRPLLAARPARRWPMAAHEGRVAASMALAGCAVQEGVATAAVCKRAIWVPGCTGEAIYGERWLAGGGAGPHRADFAEIHVHVLLLKLATAACCLQAWVCLSCVLCIYGLFFVQMLCSSSYSCHTKKADRSAAQALLSITSRMFSSRLALCAIRQLEAAVALSVDY